MKRLRRPIRSYIMSKIVGLFLVGTLHAAPNPQAVKLAHAIAHAEGFGVAHAIPTVCNNPGDLKGTTFVGQVGVCKGGHARFRTPQAGWDALYRQVSKILDGTSTKYTNRATFEDVAKRYAQNYRPWLKIVTNELGVEPEDSITDWGNKNRETFDLTELTGGFYED